MKARRAKNYILLACVLLISTAGQLFLLPAIGTWYTYAAVPAFWLLLSIYCYFNRYKKRCKRAVYSSVLIWSVVSAILTLSLLYLSGLLDGLAKNAYDTSLWGILKNLYAFGTVIVMREYVRAYIVGRLRPKKKDTRLFCFLTCFIFTLNSLNLARMFRNLNTPLGIFEQLGGNLLPAVCISIMLTYFSYLAGSRPSIVCALLSEIPLYILPIVPNSRWITGALLRTLIPFFTILILNFDVDTITKSISRRDLREENPMNWIPTFGILLVFMLFVVGIFPLQPVSVATGSMEPAIMTGDMVIISKLSNDSIEVGDVIQYKRSSYTVIHRVIETVEDAGGAQFYRTKGDNNSGADPNLVSQDAVIGKVVLRVPYAGWVTLWMHSESVEDTAENEVDIEMGGNNR